tara:strand:- start:15531 stop:15740 length:210 start_codon:yes stop_codon:yes gene_type:complete
MGKIKIPSETWVELYSHLADQMVEYSALDAVTTINDQGDEVYTEQAQENFIHCSEIVEDVLGQYFIKEK